MSTRIRWIVLALAMGAALAGCGTLDTSRSGAIEDPADLSWGQLN